MPNTPARSVLNPLRVAIIGAGVMGMSIAWRLVQAGAAVTLFDRYRAGTGATHAAAGMLAAGLEGEPGEEDLHPLCDASQRMWPDFARELAAESGLDLGYRDEGTLSVALSRDDAAKLRHDLARLTALGCELAWADSRELRRREPCLNPAVVGGLISPRDHQVDNRMVARALIECLGRRGVEIHQEAAVALATAGGRAIGVRSGDRLHEADIVVLAAGAWSAEVEGVPPAARPPVRPCKGQMMALAMDPAAPLLNHVVWGPGIYLVPRRDGRLILGATVEEKGFDTTLTAGGMLSLLHAAWRVLPGIEELPVLESWVGFRPRARDDAPLLGPTAGLPGLIHASGHHRNGILLTPATADLIARCILDGAMPALGRRYSPDRFAATATKEAS